MIALAAAVALLAALCFVRLGMEAVYRDRLCLYISFASFKVKKITRGNRPMDWDALIPAALKTLKKVFRRIRFDKLVILYTAGGTDPYVTAMRYTRAGVALEALSGLIDEGTIRVQEPRLRAMMDMDSSVSVWDVQLRLTLRVYQCVAALVCFFSVYTRVRRENAGERKRKNGKSDLG